MTPETAVTPLLASEERRRPPIESTWTDSPRAGWEAGGLRRFSALDGIRAFAVMAVLCYHAGISWVGGGLLGVDVFFVLSGFLITSLLCRELTRTATVRLGRFWAQRARRLLPALIILLLGVAVYAYTFRHSVDLGLIRGDALSTLLYVANWHFILADQGYFAQAAAPSPLLHTWSLAVEEQYYLIWPLVALFVVRRLGIRSLAITAGLAAVASAALMGALWAAGTSVDRLYYGTDTRAQALLVGSLIGAIGTHREASFSIVPNHWRSTPWRRRIWVAVGALGTAYLVWAWHALDGQDPFLYHGGFFVVALATGAVIVGCVTLPGSVLARFLSIPAIVFVGRISYGLYLYHWPLFLALDSAHTGLNGTNLLLVRLAVTFAAATVSFFFIEEPIRTRRAFRGRAGLGLSAAAAAGAAAAVLVATVTPSAGAAPKVVGGLPEPERQALVASRSFTTNPIRFLLTGDSVALTLGLGLSVDTVAHYGVNLYDGGEPGCDLNNVEVQLSGVDVSSTPGCAHWPQEFKHGVDAIRPDVVGVLLGRWEVSNHLWYGQWVHVGDTAWDRHLLAQLDQVADILSSTGAKVIFFTTPYLDPSAEAANGTPFPENDPARMRIWNRLIREAAAKRKRTVTVVNLNRLLDPHGQYQAVIDGFPVRSSDGIHITVDGGLWLQRSLMPTIVQLGLESRARTAHR